ncbi:MAG TPA: polysaccharide biosynthesis/export family protein [Nitrospiraceae bacterium]|jgi:polysaccharide export outer membrane protein|nr:polysaccharide biosynthesis/export family protein [Nitrospiraceae bacterium]
MNGSVLTRLLCWVLIMSFVGAPLGCRNPAQSTLPPSAIPPVITSAPLPKGDLYADETAVAPDATIEAGDTLEVQIRRGAGEEKFTAVVRENGVAAVSFVELNVGGVTVAEAERRIQERFTSFMRNPRVQLQLKKRTLKLKRVFVFGDVKKPGMHPLSRNMTVLQAITLAENYNETALLDEIRVIRGNLVHPEILTADLARLFTYGDWSRNLSVQENDIVFVPRERLGDASEAAKKLMPIVSLAIQPLFAAFLLPTFAPGVVPK